MRILMMIHRQDDASPYCFYVHEQAKALKARGHEVTVISCLPLPPLAARFRPSCVALDRRTPREAVVDGIPVYYPRCISLGNSGERLFGGQFLARAALPIARRLHEAKPFDVVHAHMLPRDGHAGLIVSRALGVPLVLTVHGTDVLHYFILGEKPWNRNVKIAREADALLAVSSLLMERVAPYRPSGFRMVVPNGVDLSLIPEDTENIPRKILSVGTLKARKCMDRTLEAFSRIAGDFPDATLTIVGVGPMEGQLRGRISELGLSDRVTLTGGLPHEEVLRLMAKSDVFVLPSWGEGYGIVYIEAMAAGMIAVGAEDEGIRDTIKDGENGFLVPAGDADAVERVLREIFLDEASYAVLRERGRQAARALTWERNAATMEQIYDEIRSTV
ncbi:MAG: glycosyltransferase [Clostridiales bacterium]|nr:glycosyltransferase [Clostridiales bacterium]